MSFLWCECDKFDKGKQLELIKDSYITFNFNSIEELALSMKPLNRLDANKIINLGVKKIINQIPPNIILKSKPFKLTLDEFDDFIFNESIFDEDSIDIETLDDKEIEYIDAIRKKLNESTQEFILATERDETKKNSFYKQSCTIYLLEDKKQTQFFKKNIYKSNSYNNEDFVHII